MSEEGNITEYHIIIWDPKGRNGQRKKNVIWFLLPVIETVGDSSVRNKPLRVFGGDALKFIPTTLPLTTCFCSLRHG